MFQDVVALKAQLLQTSLNWHSVWPQWNYGANFGGPTKSTWTSGANSLTMGVSSAYTGKVMFGRWAVGDDMYDDDQGGIATDNSQEIHLCDMGGSGKTDCRG